MKYKLLMLGKIRLWSDEFAACLWKTYECLTASDLHEDLENHFKYFVPDAIVYGMENENIKSIDSVVYACDRLGNGRIPLVLIGNRTDCDNFREHAPNTPVSLTMEKPVDADALIGRINSVLEEGDNSRKHILVVDDDPLMLKTIKEHIHDKYDVASATRGKIALKFLEKRSTNLILLDYEMPEEKGPEVLEKLRANEATRDIPVVFLTGVTEEDKIQKAMECKPQGYLLKPIDHDKLIETIEKFLR